MNINTKTKDSAVTETHRLWKLYSTKKSTWANHAKQDREFRLGRQWTAEQERKLEARGQSPVVVNRIHPAVESAKAMLTSNNPSFRVSPREDSDNRVAQVFNGLLEYMWQISDGITELREIVDNYYVTGMGAMLIYQDPIADMGKGEVMIRSLDPMDIYIDPNSRKRDCSDAENIIISRKFTKEQAKKLLPMYKKAIKAASSELEDDSPSTGQANDDFAVTFPEDVSTLSDTETEYIRGYERYTKEEVKKYRLFEKFSGKEHLFDEHEYIAKMQTPVWVIQEQVVTDPEQAQVLIQTVTQQYEQQYAQVLAMAQQQGQPPPPPPQIPIETITYEVLIQKQMVDVIEVKLPRVKQTVIMGNKKLYERVLPTEHYPIAFFMNLHTGTPYPTSDVRLVRGLQQYINKTRSLIIAHATTSTNIKVMVPEGSIDMKEFEEKWAQPGVGIAVDFAEGQPVLAQPVPLPNELYKNESDAKQDIDHQLGLYELMMGNSQAAPSTYKATISIDEFGQRKIRSKQMDIEAGLKRVAEVAIPLMQQLYTEEKVVRLIQPNNSLNEYVINKRLVDDKTGEIKIFNDITVGMYDVIPVTGKTLPTNRYAQLELYMDAYRNGVIDRQEVLKKTEVFDMEGVLQRTDTLEQLQQQLQGAGEQIKKLEGDLQTRDREAVNLRKKVEVEKFKGSLDKTSHKASSASTIFESRLDETLKAAKKDLMHAIKVATLEAKNDLKKEDTSKKSSSKKGEK